MIQLVKPAEKYKDSYLSSLLEEDAHHFPRDVVQHIADDFAAFVQKQTTIQTGDFTALDGNTYPIDPQHAYWLVDDGVFVGDICLRTSLNPFMESFGGHVGYRVRPSRRRQSYGTQMLAVLMTLAQKEHGMSQLMILCSHDNTASQKVILKNGGVFQTTRTYHWSDARMNVYGIDL